VLDAAGLGAARDGLPARPPCPHCGGPLSGHVATFSFRKSFRTPAYPSIWYHAEALLAEADHWIFVGYSLPEADHALKHLLEAAEARARPGATGRRRIEAVVEKDPAARQKFERFFGSALTSFHDGRLADYVGVPSVAPAA
jgi:hypothetical protein